LSNQLAFINYIQKHQGHKENNINTWNGLEIQEIEIDLIFWEQLARDNERMIKEECMKCWKVWDFIDDLTTKWKFPSFGPTKYFFPVHRVMNYLKEEIAQLHKAITKIKKLKEAIAQLHKAIT